jgi:hypothetical protein
VSELTDGDLFRASASDTIEPADAWTRAVIEYFGDAGLAPFEPLLAHCIGAVDSAPNRAWLREARRLVGTLDPDAHITLLRIALEAVGTEAADLVRYDPDGLWVGAHPRVISPRCGNMLRGLLWTAPMGSMDVLLDPLAAAAERCFVSLPIGPVSPRTANACLRALSRASDERGLWRLCAFRNEATQPSAINRLDARIDEAVAHLGLSSHDLTDMATPECGLTAMGERSERIWKYTATLRADSAGGVRVEWQRGGGPVLDEPSPALAARLPAPIQALERRRATVEEALRLARRQRDRLARGGRGVPLARWERWYRDHPIMGVLATSHEWRFSEVGDVRLVTPPR